MMVIIALTLYLPNSSSCSAHMMSYMPNFWKTAFSQIFNDTPLTHANMIGIASTTLCITHTSMIIGGMVRPKGVVVQELTCMKYQFITQNNQKYIMFVDPLLMVHKVCKHDT